ncbi:hypothetical protein C8R46DRAFT_1217024 [Mycena filopes]|nr:hypothetical protein C8R46DRAFT_1217024 [Mycena filopes]
MIWDWKHLKLTVLSLVVFGLINEQTSGWSTLLTPTNFEYNTRITGREIDLNKDVLQAIQLNGALDYCVYNATNLPSFTVGQTESGLQGASSYWELPQSLTLMDWVYTSPTEGIIPLTFDTLNGTWFENNQTNFLSGTLGPSIPFKNAQSVNVSMVQQGFSADVSCTFQDLTPSTTPSLVIQDTLVVDPLDATNATVHRTMESNCASPSTTQFQALNWTEVVFTNTNNSGSFLMVACAGSNGTYDLIFSGGGGGLYGFLNTTMCNVKPITTTVHVDYAEDYIDAFRLPDRGETVNTGSPAGLSAVTAMYNLVSFAQAPITNIMGDQLRALLLNNDASSGSDETYRTDILGTLENYIRGVTEYTGTVFKACVSSKGGPVFPDGLSPNMEIVSTGKLHTEFLGWTVTDSTSWVLFPGAIIALATIYIVLGAVAMDSAGGNANAKRDPFDPSNTMHLISTSAGGGLRDAVAGTKKEDMTAAEKVAVVLKDTEGQGWVLTHE